jgi:predicted nucleic acid-binding protein
MKAFLDADVIVSVLNKEYPLYTYSSRILSLSGTDYFQLYTSPLCLAISFYFSSKKSGEQKAKQKINILMENICLTTINESVARNAIKNPRIHDFEDGLEYYSAIEKSCEVIITEDKADYFFSEIEVLNCEEFIAKYCRDMKNSALEK